MFNFALSELLKAYPESMTEEPMRKSGLPTMDLFRWLVVNWYRQRKRLATLEKVTALYRIRERNKDKNLIRQFENNFGD